MEEKQLEILWCDDDNRDKLNKNPNGDENSVASTSFKIHKQTGCDKSKLRSILNSPKFHFFIIALVVVDCLFVAGELIIDYIEIHISKTNTHNFDEFYFKANTRDMDLMYENVTTNQTLSPSNFVSKSNLSTMKTLKVLEKICKYSSFTILTIFVVDILAKVLIEPRKFLKILELFDAIVVFSGFFLNLYLIKSNVVIHSLSGLITVLRFYFLTYLFSNFSHDLKYFSPSHVKNASL